MTDAVRDLVRPRQSPSWNLVVPMAFSVTSAGLLADGPFPDFVAITDEVEREAVGPYMRRARNFLVFRLVNGQARYRLVERRHRGLPGGIGESLWQLEFKRELCTKPGGQTEGNGFVGGDALVGQD